MLYHVLPFMNDELYEGGEDENPNDGQYVIVDFPQYCGPPWMIERLLGFPYHPLNYHVKITVEIKQYMKNIVDKSWRTSNAINY